MATEQEHFNACRQFQEYYQNALSNVGVRVPAPVFGQTLGEYRRESDRTFKRSVLPQNHPLYQVNWRGLRDDALEVLEPQLLEAVKVEAVNPAHLNPGEIRAIPKTDPKTGQKRIDWIGQQSFVKDMMRPGRRFVSFTTDRGKYDAAKARWF
jgi:hypothetical protein